MAKNTSISDETVMNKIYLLKGQRVMIDRDLAKMYNVTTGNLNKAVKRNIARFPEDFMFRLSLKEYKNLIFQNGIASWGGSRLLPYAFTEQGVAMLSSVLKSERAVLVNVHIMRVFTKMRQILATHKHLLSKLKLLESKVVKQDHEIRVIFSYLKELLNSPMQPRPIGFKQKPRG